MCLNKQDSEYASGPKYGKILDMAGFSICSEYARICLDRVLSICWVLNIPDLYIQDSEYGRVQKMHTKYATICLNVWIYNNRQGCKYVSYNT